ncbi:hypothetical protein BGZ65_010962 [Modicella reniformis]|uniref:C3H1-type domain-containing protein n=1 Tax=Modicella reniformis TaxID=1440133 RepID=A0A9P6IMR4_9FUNG|nr:hypothetical protein BGZ65_010962 [Modicella reniformis]
MSTRVCRFFLSGNCRNGTSCRFYHEGFSSIPHETLTQALGSDDEASTSSRDRAGATSSSTGVSSSSSSRPAGLINSAYRGNEEASSVSGDDEGETAEASSSGANGLTANHDSEDDEDQKCAICFEVPKTFGLLTCPEQKEIIIQNYKEATGRKPCKYFKESGVRHWCPFGDDCHFAHLDENGEPCKVNPESNPRLHRQRRRGGRYRAQRHNVTWDAEETFPGFEALVTELTRLHSVSNQMTGTWAETLRRLRDRFYNEFGSEDGGEWPADDDPEFDLEEDDGEDEVGYEEYSDWYETDEEDLYEGWEGDNHY